MLYKGDIEMYDNWTNFVKSGRISDYLKYKDIDTNTMNTVNVKEPDYADYSRGNSSPRENDQRERQIY